MNTFVILGLSVACMVLAVRGHLVGLLIGGALGSFIGVAGFGGAISGMLPGAIFGGLISIARKRAPDQISPSLGRDIPAILQHFPDGTGEKIVSGVRNTAAKLVQIAAALVVIVVALLVGGISKDIAKEKLADEVRHETYGDKFAAAAAEINKTLPKQIDADARLDSVSSDRGAVFTYNYTLTSLRTGVLDENSIEAARLNTYRIVCAQKATNYLANGIAIRNTYKTSDGTALMDVTVSPKDCEALATIQNQTTTRASTNAYLPEKRAKPIIEEKCEFKPVMTDHEIAVCRR